MLKLIESSRWAFGLLVVVSLAAHTSWYVSEMSTGYYYDFVSALRVQMVLWCVSLALGYLMGLSVFSDEECFESSFSQSLVRISWWGLAVTVIAFYILSKILIE